MPSELSRPKTRAKRPRSRPAADGIPVTYFVVFHRISVSSAGFGSFGSFGTAGRRVRGRGRSSATVIFEPLVP